MNTVSQRVDEQTSHVLYNGTVHLDFDPVKHTYKINGQYASGVTTALNIIDKSFLKFWAVNKACEYVKARIVPGVAMDEIEIQEMLAGAKKAHTDFAGSAADMGTYVHNWIEDFVNGKEPIHPTNERLQRVINDFLEWWNNTNVEVVHAERMLCSPKYMLAGTPDLICKVDGKLTIMDWKTGSGIYPDMFLQMAAYAMMWEEEFPDQKVEQLYVVNASIRNMFQTECRTEVEFFKKTYLEALALYKSNKQLEELFKKGGK